MKYSKEVMEKLEELLEEEGETSIKGYLLEAELEHMCEECEKDTIGYVLHDKTQRFAYLFEQMWGICSGNRA
jgi:hypothetical protein